MSDESRCECQRCGQAIEFPTVMGGQDVACPHCGRETTLSIPTVRKAAPIYARPSPAPPPQSSVAGSTIGCSYALCFLIPIAGFFAGVYLMTKKETGHGAACMAISIVFGLVLIAMFSSM